MTLAVFHRGAFQIGVWHFGAAQSAAKSHFSDAVERWNVAITEEPHQAEQQKPDRFLPSQNTPSTGGTFPDSLYSDDLADIKGTRLIPRQPGKQCQVLVNDASWPAVIKSLKFHNWGACVMETESSRRAHPSGGKHFFFLVGLVVVLSTNPSVTAGDEG